MSSVTCEFSCRADERATSRKVQLERLVIAGWTGRNQAAVEAHIRELEALGVPRPKQTPIFYSAGVNLLTQAARIQVAGRDSTGEIEPVIVSMDGDLWLGIGSDHTDRALERGSVTLSKQVCPKPIAHELWRLADVEDRLDRLELRSYAKLDGARRLYQQGTLAAVRPLRDLLTLCFGAPSLPPGTAMFCGTLAVEGGIKYATGFEMELLDPTNGQVIRHAYEVEDLPVEG